MGLNFLNSVFEFRNDRVFEDSARDASFCVLCSKVVSHSCIILKLFYFVTHVGSKYYSECFFKNFKKKNKPSELRKKSLYST